MTINLSEDLKKQVQERILEAALQTNTANSPWAKKPVQDVLREFAVNFTASVLTNQDNVRQTASVAVSELWKYGINSRDFILLCDRFTSELNPILSQAFEAAGQTDQLRKTMTYLNHQGLMLRLGVVHANMEVAHRSQKVV